MDRIDNKELAWQREIFLTVFAALLQGNEKSILRVRKTRPAKRLSKAEEWRRKDKSTLA